MKHLLAVTAIAVTISASMAEAGPIRRACLASDRAAATRALCSCIERTAKPIFSRSEMRRIAKFFKDPQLTQILRQSSRRADELFWERYKAWAEAAEQRCG